MTKWCNTALSKLHWQMKLHSKWKWSIPVSGSTHFLLFVCAGGRVSVSIVVKTVEGVVGVIKHSYTLRSQMCDPKCLAPRTLLAKAQQQPPCPAALLSMQLTPMSELCCWWRLPPAPLSPPHHQDHLSDAFHFTFHISFSLSSIYFVISTAMSKSGPIENLKIYY